MFTSDMSAEEKRQMQMVQMSPDPLEELKQVYFIKKKKKMSISLIRDVQTLFIATSARSSGRTKVIPDQLSFSRMSWVFPRVFGQVQNTSLGRCPGVLLTRRTPSADSSGFGGAALVRFELFRLSPRGSSAALQRKLIWTSWIWDLDISVTTGVPDHRWE